MSRSSFQFLGRSKPVFLMGIVDKFRHSLLLKPCQAKNKKNKKIIINKIKGCLPSVKLLANLPVYEREWRGEVGLLLNGRYNSH